MTVTLLVIAKEPVPGRAKTRLSPPCTPEEAAEIAAAALADTLDAVHAAPAARRVLVLDGHPGDWLPASARAFDVVPQVAGGLAERLAGAFAVAGGPAFLIGMDTPQLDAALLSRAAADLEGDGVDAVLGPARDGGWWGIGLRHPDPRVFRGVPMSTPATGAAQRARLAELGLATRLLPVLDDVDTFADARRVAAEAPAGRFGRTVRRVEARR